YLRLADADRTQAETCVAAIRPGRPERAAAIACAPAVAPRPPGRCSPAAPGPAALPRLRIRAPGRWPGTGATVGRHDVAPGRPHRRACLLRRQDPLRHRRKSLPRTRADRAPPASVRPGKTTWFHARHP